MCHFLSRAVISTLEALASATLRTREDINGIPQDLVNVCVHTGSAGALFKNPGGVSPSHLLLFPTPHAAAVRTACILIDGGFPYAMHLLATTRGHCVSPSLFKKNEDSNLDTSTGSLSEDS